MLVSETTSTRRTGRTNRYRQIIEILAHHGFGFIFGKVQWNGRQFLHRVRGHNEEEQAKAIIDAPERLRRAIEDLGPTFIKLGQILSTRGDLLPARYREELAKLQDSAPPVPSDVISAILQEELKQPIEDVFARFDMTPLASASIGQAHLAILPSGTEVVVKLRRPGIIEQVEEDLQVMLDLARMASRHWEVARYYDLVAIAEEFAQTLRAELDYLHEAANVERIASNFAGNPNVHIPTVYWDTTTSRMLTLERIHGCKITDIRGIEAEGLDRSRVAHRAARILLTMILGHGFFHADPHAGNVFVESDGVIGLIDFGMIGQADGATQNHLMQLMIGITQKDAGKLSDVMLELGMARAHVDRNALRRDMQRVLARYWDRPIGDVKFAAFLADMIEILRWHHLRLSPDLALLLKTLAMGEGLAEELDPTFNLMEVYVPLTEELLRERFTFANWTKQFLLSGIDSLQMGLEAPQQLHRILGDIERGGFEINIQPASFDPYLNRLERLINRVLIALFATASTIATALIVAAYHPSGLDRLAEVLFLGSLTLTMVFGGYILFLLIRAKRR